MYYIMMYSDIINSNINLHIPWDSIYIAQPE